MTSIEYGIIAFALALTGLALYSTLANGPGSLVDQIVAGLTDRGVPAARVETTAAAPAPTTKDDATPAPETLGAIGLRR